MNTRSHSPLAPQRGTCHPHQPGRLRFPTPTFTHAHAPIHPRVDNGVATINPCGRRSVRTCRPRVDNAHMHARTRICTHARAQARARTHARTRARTCKRPASTDTAQISHAAAADNKATTRAPPTHTRMQIHGRTDARTHARTHSGAQNIKPPSNTPTHSGACVGMRHGGA